MANKKGYTTEVAGLPNCDFCSKTARFDAKTRFGSWAYMCNECFRVHGIGLGIGKGQRLIKI